MDNLDAELAFAVGAAEAAGAVLRGYFGQALAIEHKDRGEPVSVADRAAEAVILEGLRAAFPGDGVLAEEQADRASWLRHARAWLVDPLDGTRDFLAGREGFCVMIGLLVEARPVLGVIHAPMTAVTYCGAVGLPAVAIQGAQRLPLLPSAVADLAQVRLVTSYSHRSARTEAARAVVGACDEQRLGSVGLKVAAIARGERDLYVNPDGHCKLWDTCAPEALLLAAGGRMTDLRGRALVYDDPTRLRLEGGIVASNGHCHAAALARVAPFAADPAAADKRTRSSPRSS